jgi:PST family polysaccharide transporter
MEENSSEGPLRIQTRLSELFATGVLWSGGSSIITSAVRLLNIAILARLLAPKDFGLFSLTLLLVDFGNDLGDLGTGPAIIQRKEVSQRLLSTIFWLTIIGGGCIFIISSILAPVFAWFFHEKMLTKLIIVSSLSFIIRPSGFVHRALLQKKLSFNRIGLIEIGSTMVFGLVSITLALKGYGVWSLVYGLLTHRIADVILAWLMSEFRPSLEFESGEIRKVLHFIKNITGERVTYFLSSRMDYVIIGRLLGSTFLGFYTLASEITRLPQRRLSAIITTVAFPTFSRMQEENERLKNSYIKVNKTLSLITFPLMGGLAAFAPEFVRAFYGPGWEPVIVPMQILCALSAIRSIMHNNGTIFYIKNRPDLAFRWGLIQMITIPIPLLIGATYGLRGVAIALTITFIFYFVYIQKIINSLIDLHLLTYLRNFQSIITSSILIIVFISIYKVGIKKIVDVNNIVILLSGSIITAILYLISVRLFNQSSWYEINSLFRSVFSIKTK